MINDITILKLNIDEYIKSNYVKERRVYKRRTFSSESMMPSMAPVDLDYTCNERSINDYLDKQDKTFQERLFFYIDSKGYNDTDVYLKAHLDRRLFSKIRSNVDFKPSKKSAISLCFGLMLKIDEALDLLSRAGYTLSNSSKFDLIVKYFLEKEEYDIDVLNQILYDYGLDTLYI